MEEEFIAGFYDDDGNRIYPTSLPKPGLCLICQMDACTDPEENMLCAMNRWDQRNDENFECGVFRRIDKKN